MTAKAKPADPSDALDPKKALVPSVVKINEMRVTKGFWPKIQRTAARIPFADQALAAWYAARDPQTPMAAKGMIFAGLGFVTMVLYLVMNGSGGRVASVIAYLALKALVAGGAWLLWRYMLTLKWEKLPARDLDTPQA